MKYLFSFCLMTLPFWAFSQYYPNIVSHHLNDTPASGVKIKTNIPFSSSVGMPLVKIQGYDYGPREVLDLSIVWYVYKEAFTHVSVSSSGGSVPVIRLSNENGKISIHLDKNVYFQRFFVSAFARGLKEQPGYFSNWSVVNEPFGGSNIIIAPYKNSFSGTITMPGGVWSPDGNVGIGTTTPSHKLEVNGTVRAKKVKLEAANWPDYVFGRDYQLMPLEEVKGHIEEKGHLPGLKPAAEYEADGVNMLELNQKLLEKIEELTLYLLQQQGLINSQRLALESQGRRLEAVEEKLENINTGQ